MNLSVKLHNKTVDTYNLINAYDSNFEYGVFSLNQGTYGTIIHEYMHVLGLPDLYRYNDDGLPVGFYDLMSIIKCNSVTITCCNINYNTTITSITVK